MQHVLSTTLYRGCMQHVREGQPSHVAQLMRWDCVVCRFGNIDAVAALKEVQPVERRTERVR